MIKTTQRNIVDNGIKYKEDGYCYLVTEENFDFWFGYINFENHNRVPKLVTKTDEFKNTPERLMKFN